MIEIRVLQEIRIQNPAYRSAIFLFYIAVVLVPPAACPCVGYHIQRSVTVYEYHILAPELTDFTLRVSKKFLQALRIKPILTFYAVHRSTSNPVQPLRQTTKPDIRKPVFRQTFGKQCLLNFRS